MLSSRTAPGPRRTPRVLAGAGALTLLLVGCSPGGTSASSSTKPTATSAASTDWRNAAYQVTCDGLVQSPFPAKLVDGAARVPVDASRSPDYQDVDVLLESTATGDVDGDGKPDTVVLLKCTPQPSNGSVEEVHVYRADGSELGVLPSPGSLPEASVIAPLYVPEKLSVQRGEIVAPMKAYGFNDSHATGPTVPVTVQWKWNGSSFERVS